MQHSVNLPTGLLGRSNVQSIRCFSGIATSEPSKPSMKTHIPGPKSEQLKKEMAKVHVSFFFFKYIFTLNFSKIHLLSSSLITKNLSATTWSMLMAIKSWIPLCKSLQSPWAIIILTWLKLVNNPSLW